MCEGIVLKISRKYIIPKGFARHYRMGVKDVTRSDKGLFKGGGPEEELITVP